MLVWNERTCEFESSQLPGAFLGQQNGRWTHVPMHQMHFVVQVRQSLGDLKEFIE